MEKFYFSFFFRYSWLPRKVEKISYLGDMKWERRISLDLDIGHLSHFHKAATVNSDNDCYSDDESDGKKRQYVIVPFALWEKDRALLDVELENRAGLSLNLIEESTCAWIALRVLIGAVVEDIGNVGGARIASCRFLTQFLTQIFKADIGTFDDARSPDCDKAAGDAIGELWTRRLEEAIEATSAELNRAEEPDSEDANREEKIHSLEEDLRDLNLSNESFDYLFNNSVRFRYFLHLFSSNRLLCTTLDVLDSNSSILKYKTVEPGNLVDDTTYVVNRDLTIRMPFDPYPYADNFCLHLVPPKGTKFRKNKRPEIKEMNETAFSTAHPETQGNRQPTGRKTGNDKDSMRRIHIRRYLPQPYHITIESRPYRDLNGEPARRIPSKKSQSSQTYEIAARLLPDLGKRKVFFTMLFVLSFFVWMFVAILSWFNPYGLASSLAIAIVGLVIPTVSLYSNIFQEVNWYTTYLCSKPINRAAVCLAADIVLLAISEILLGYGLLDAVTLIGLGGATLSLCLYISHAAWLVREVDDPPLWYPCARTIFYRARRLWAKPQQGQN